MPILIKYTPILIKTNRLDAPFRMVQGNLFENVFCNKKWDLYELFIVSDREITKESRYVLSTTLKVVAGNKAKNTDMVLEYSSNKKLPLPIIEEEFLKKYAKYYNNKNVIVEVEIDFEKSSHDCTKIKSFRTFKEGWIFPTRTNN